MSVAHFYDAMPGGGQALPNVPLAIDGRPGALADLFAAAAVPQAFWFAPSAGVEEGAALVGALGRSVRLVVVGARLPGQVGVTDTEGKLAIATAAKPGEVLLVHGAGGGSGLTAIEVGKAMGAVVIASATTNRRQRASATTCLRSCASRSA